MNNNHNRARLLSGLLFLSGASILFEGVTRYFNDDFTDSLFKANAGPVNIGAALIMLAGAGVVTLAAVLFQRGKYAENHIT